MSNWTVYIVRCSDNSFYTGITTDVHRRVDEHNIDNKKSAAYTRARRPVRLVYQETFNNRSEASRREYQIKQLKRGEKQTLLKNVLT